MESLSCSICLEVALHDNLKLAQSQQGKDGHLEDKGQDRQPDKQYDIRSLTARKSQTDRHCRALSDAEADVTGAFITSNNVRLSRSLPPIEIIKFHTITDFFQIPNRIYPDSLKDEYL